MKEKEMFELDNLNLEDLDVQELEARLELSVASPGAAAPGTCSGDKGCSGACANCKNCYNGCVTGDTCVPTKTT